ncbi:MAG: CCA tRNA nucleotidyltransferase [Lachnospiraceae bacterium]|jgi:tRNA nucleotidyltransferase (CCA-adding enzyme)|nr:CCA tRNA nucleotidyltransferase [Lachnospiraceae bacterium]
MMMELPYAVTTIIKSLNEAGYEAFAVGGCVRDSLLLRTPGDWDITTQATPEEVKRIFKRTVDTGIQHGTVTVLIDKEGFEVTTYRVDGEYEDGRHPKEVSFTASLREDLRRRDFTINAMAYHPDTGLVDLFDGIGDLEKKRICCVGDARERFTEDALRILRAARFGAQLGFSIEEKTRKAMRTLAQRLSMVSVERIYTEFRKLMETDYPEYLFITVDTKVFEVILPELAGRMAQEEVRERLLAQLKNSPKELYVRLALLFDACLDVPQEEKKDATGKLLRRLKTDRETIEIVKTLVSLAQEELPAEELAIRQFLSRYGEAMLGRFLMMREVNSGKSFGEQRLLASRIMQRGDCVTVKGLAISGAEVMDLGVKQGRKVGEILNRLLNEVLKTPELNEKTRLVEMVKQWIE